MRINLRKVLALMLSVLMLCTLIPLSALSVSAADPVVSFDLDFNDGTNKFNGGSVVAEGPDGSNCLKWTASGGWSAIYFTAQNVYENGTYVISFKSKASVAGQMSITIQDGGWADYYYKEVFNTSTTWKEYEIVTSVSDYPTSGGAILFKFQDQGTAMDLYIDDLTMYEYIEEEPETPLDGENLVVNGDFETGSLTGWTKHQSTVISTNSYNGSYAVNLKGSGGWGGMFNQNITVEAGKKYTVSMWAKTISNGANIQVKDGGTEGENLESTWFTKTEWTQITWEVTPTTTILCINFCGGGNGVAEDVLVDDITVMAEKVASFDGFIYNGDFELGTLQNWTGYNSTAVSTDAAYSGNYGAHLKGNGSYGGIMYQNTVNVVANKTYVVSFYIKVVANGMNFQIKDGNQNGSALISKQYSVGDWKLIELEVTPSQNGFCINFCGQGSSSSAVSGKEEVAYVDDIKVTLKGGNPEEKVTYGGASVRDEAAEGDKTGKGLAFQFTVSAVDGKKNYNNTYEEKSGKVVLGDQKHILVRMGAVMTNNATVGQNAASFNLGAVDGKKIIDIPAVYLNGATEEALSFAVRILDIPDKHIGTAIYARPYYVYLENGEETTVYGETRSNNYAKAANISTADKTKPIKILSIGHSFSKDVMTTNLYNMFIEGGYTNVTIGYLYMAGCSMPKHLYNIQNNLAQYEYAKNSTGSWVTKSNVKALTALQEEEWDFVTVQSSPDYIGGQTISGFSLGVNNDGTKVTLSSPQTEYEAMDQITDWILANATNANVKIDYHMIWSFSEDCELWSYAYHDYDQMTMYNNIINITQTEVQNHEDINRVIPSATAIQNVRTSFMGDNFNAPVVPGTQADGYHLNDYGDYVAALTWYCHYSGDNANIMAGYLGDGSVLSLTVEEFQAIAEAVNNAIDIPWAVTESTHK